MSNRKQFTLEELKTKFYLLKHEIDDRQAQVIAYVDGEESYNMWDFDHPEATPEELEAARAACIRAALRKAGISLRKSPPPYEDIEAEVHRRAQDYSESLRAYFETESWIETGQW